MNTTKLSSVASLLTAGMLMGGCMADVGGESEREGGAAQEPNVVGGEAVGEAQQALSNGRRFNALSEPAGLSARADLQVWRSSNSTWYAQRTSDGYGFGWALSRPAQPQDVPVSMNIDGDALADEVTWRPSDGVWQYRLSSTGLQYQIQWGAAGDIPTPGDFDGDGKTDFAYWRASESRFYIIRSSNWAGGITVWGGLGDIPVIGNYDGDTRDDIAVFRPSNGTWYYIRSSTGSGVAIQWGTAGDIPVAGDFDGDGKTDLTVFRPSNGSWYTLKSSTGTSTVTQWGATCDVPLPADYDGDGKTDIGVRRMETAANYFINSSTGAGVGTVYGLTTDVPANASTFCYLNGALGPCRSATCGPVGGSGGGGLECKMFKGVSGHGYMVGFQKCGRTASWKAYPYNGQYSQYVVDGDSGVLGSWHVVNPKVMGSTTSTTARNSFFSGVTDIRGDCNACVQ